MNDLTKTLIFVGSAAVVALVAFLFRPEPFEQPRQNAGEKLFSELEDSATADALEIVTYDSDRSKPVSLQIERDGEDWVIASHNNYPADASGAKDRIQQVALKLMDLEILNVASELPSDHAWAGVVEPPAEGDVPEGDDDDIGMLVGLKDSDGNTLAKLIIGKEARDEQSQQTKRFVRKVGEPTIYTAAIDTADLKSEFSDWIDSDLLKISGSDIRRVTIKDYNARLVDVGGGQRVTAIDPRFELSVNWNSEDSQWTFGDMVERRGNSLVPTSLTENEELNGESLDELKSTVDNLKIVDATAKPKELIEGVKSEEDLVNDPVLGRALREKGFYPARGELLASEGEVRIQTDDAIEYILRFGSEAGVFLDDEDNSKLTRFMLVTAAVAEDQLVEAESTGKGPPSTDNPLGPAFGAGGQTGEEGDAGEDANETDDSAEDQTAEDGSPDEGSEATSSESPANDTSETPVDSEPTDDSDSSAEDGPMPPNTIPPGESSDGPDNIAGPADTAQEDELTKKRREAEEKVKELNEKFVKWYYVISEDEYKNLRLGRFDVIKEKDEASFGIDELRGLDDLPPTPDATPEPDSEGDETP